MKILITCPPMLKSIEHFDEQFKSLGYEYFIPDVAQTLPEKELIQLVPKFDGWIIGDDPATRKVFEAGKSGLLKAAVKWGVGTDNVDFDACADLRIPIKNTPQMFGEEVADLAMCYVTSLARQTQIIHQGILNNKWPKPIGISLNGKKCGVVGFGDIGKNTAKRLISSSMEVIAYDPCFASDESLSSVRHKIWPDSLNELDFLIFTCSLNDQNHHMFNQNALDNCKNGLRIVNVARGPLIDENVLIQGLTSGKIHSAALDVFEVEPLPANSELRNFKQCLFGSHNGSNTIDAVIRTSLLAIDLIHKFLLKN